MELVAGPSLSETLRDGPLAEKDVLRLGAQLARGLQAAHEQGVIHRDLKPSNLHLTPDGLLKILDFGLARLLQPKTGPPGHSTATETAAGAIVGSPPYMAPEQLLGRPPDPRTDLYAAGAVLYELASGHRPFGTRTGAALTDAILHQPPLPPSAVAESLSPGLEGVILKALDKDAELRYQSARELVVDIERLQLRSSSGSAAVRSTADSRGRGDAGPDTAGATTGAHPADVPGERAPRSRERLAWAIGAAALLAWRDPNRTPEERPLVRFGVDVPASFPLHNVAVSPDGRHVAFSALEPGPPGIWVRSLESHEGRPLPVPATRISRSGLRTVGRWPSSRRTASTGSDWPTASSR